MQPPPSCLREHTDTQAGEQLTTHRAVFVMQCSVNMLDKQALQGKV